MSYNAIEKLHIALGDYPHRVFANAAGTLKGINVYVGGGTDPHIGAVTISIPRPSLEDPSKGSLTTSVFNCVGHKDDVIARMFSEAICLELGCTVTVSAGIHIDSAEKKDIDKFTSLSKRLLDELIEELKRYDLGEGI